MKKDKKVVEEKKYSIYEEEEILSRPSLGKLKKTLTKEEWHAVKKERKIERNAKIKDYYYGLGKELRKIKWADSNEFKTSVKNTLLFILVFMILFAAIDLILSLLRFAGVY